MKTVGFIFARGGSKGLPKKNVRDFCGKPLIAWAVEKALKVEKIDRVIVSTDCPEIAHIAREYGAEVPFLRPAALASDESPEWESWQHVLNFLIETEGEAPEIMVSIPTVAPLGLASDIEVCMNEFEKNSSDIVITVTAAKRSPYFNMVKQNDQGFYELIDSKHLATRRRQDAPIVFDITTVCYVASSSFVLARKSIFEGRVKVVELPAERSIDIDSELDFKIAEFLFSQIHN